MIEEQVRSIKRLPKSSHKCFADQVLLSKNFNFGYMLIPFKISFPSEINAAFVAQIVQNLLE